MTLRLGIIGAHPDRGWARDSHLPALRLVPDIAITAVAARTLDTARAASAVFDGAAPYGDAIEMIRTAPIDAVAVTVKVPEHHALVMAALAAGKHVYCEWPLGRTSQQAREMAAAQGAQVAVVGLQALSSPELNAVARMIAEGHLGRITDLHLRTNAGAWGAVTQSYNAYLQDAANGATMETIGAGHTLAAIEMLIGPYARLRATAETRQTLVPVEDTGATVTRTCADHMVVEGEHVAGARSTLEVLGGRSAVPLALTITGEKGTVRLTGTAPGMCQVIGYHLDSDLPLPPLPAPDRFTPLGHCANVGRSWARLVDAVEGRAGTTLLPDFAKAVALHDLLDTIAAATARGLMLEVGARHA